MKPTIEALRDALPDERGSEGHPSSEEYAKFFSRQVSEDDDDAFLDHILACPRCRREFGFLSRLSLRVEPLLVKIERLGLRDEESGPMRFPARERRFRREGGVAWPAWLRSPLGRAASLAAVGVLVVLASLFILRRPERLPLPEGPYRGGEQPALELLTPGVDAAVSDPVFVWRADARAKSYKFELLDAGLSLLWEEVVRGRNRIALPAPVRASLRSRAAYFWKVTAYDDAGRDLGSGLRGFRIR